MDNTILRFDDNRWGLRRNAPPREVAARLHRTVGSTSSPTQVSDKEEDPEGDECNPGEHLDERTCTNGFKMRRRRLRGCPDLNRPPKLDLGISIRDNDPDDMAPDVRSDEFVRRR